MTVRLTDNNIAQLMRELKKLPEDYSARLKTKPKRGHKEQELDITGENNGKFKIILRQSILNPFDFSLILSYQIPKKNIFFRLRRYNGKSHEHTNTLEGATFYDFHVHTATERYQASGLREDTYAEPTNRYSDISGAIKCMIAECALEPPPKKQSSLFEEDFRP